MVTVASFTASGCRGRREVNPERVEREKEAPAEHGAATAMCAGGNGAAEKLTAREQQRGKDE